MCQLETPEPRATLPSCRRPRFKSLLYLEGLEPKELSRHQAFADILPWVGFSVLQQLSCSQGTFH